MKSKKGIIVLVALLVFISVAIALLLVDSDGADVGTTEPQKSDISAVNTLQLSVISNETASYSAFVENENTYGFELVDRNENGVIKYGVSDGFKTIIPCEYDEISILSESRILAQSYASYTAGSFGQIVIYDDSGNIICDDGIFSDAVFEKKDGVYEQTGIGAYKKSKDLRHAEYWVIDQNGNKLSEVYTFIERVASTLPEEDYYAVRIDPDSLYMSSYRLKINGEVLEKVIHNHPDGVKARSVITGKSGNYIHLYGRGNSIEGYNNRIGGYDYVAFEVDNIDDWQIGDTVEIIYIGKIKYGDPPTGELTDIVKIQE